MFHQTVRQKKALRNCINRDVKRMRSQRINKTDCLVVGGFIGFMLAWLIRVNFNV